MLRQAGSAFPRFALLDRTYSPWLFLGKLIPVIAGLGVLDTALTPATSV